MFNLSDDVLIQVSNSSPEYNEIVDNSDYMVHMDASEWSKIWLNMPKQVKVQYGCRNCEWRDAGECTMGFKPGSRDRCKEGICKKRAHFLAGFVIGLDSYDSRKVLTFSQWQSAMLQMTTSRQHLKDDYKFQRLQRDVESLEHDIDIFFTDDLTDDERDIDYYDKDIVKHDLSVNQKKYLMMLKRLDKMRTDLHYFRNDWLNLADKMSKISSSQLDREQPKKVDINVNRTLSLEDRHKIMTGDIIDGEVLNDD